MAGLEYTYAKPYNTYTLEQFIACQSDTSVCYNNLSFIDKIGNIEYNTYNVISDYIDEIIKDYCVIVNLTDDQAFKYKYRPKLLCFDVYGNQELYPIILLINDICSVKEFTKSKLYLPTKKNMSLLTTQLFNSNRDSIDTYNSNNNYDGE